MAPTGEVSMTIASAASAMRGIMLGRHPGEIAGGNAAHAGQVEHRQPGVGTGSEDQLERSALDRPQVEPGGFGVGDAEAGAERGPPEVGVDRHGLAARFDERRGEVGGHRGLAVAAAGRHHERHGGAPGVLPAGVEEGDHAAQGAVRVRQRPVLAGAHGELVGLVVAHSRDRRVDLDAEDLGELVGGADPPVGTGEQEGDAEADRAADECAENASRHSRARRAEAALLDGHALRFLQGGEHELALVGIEAVVLLEHHAVLAAERIELGAGDRVLDRFAVGILRRHQHRGFDLVDLRFEFVEAGERRSDPVLGELVLPLGEIAREFVGERVGDGNRVVLGLLRRGDLRVRRSAGRT